MVGQVQGLPLESKGRTDLFHPIHENGAHVWFEFFMVTEIVDFETIIFFERKQVDNQLLVYNLCTITVDLRGIRFFRHNFLGCHHRVLRWTLAQNPYSLGLSFFFFVHRLFLLAAQYRIVIHPIIVIFGLTYLLVLPMRR